ncbi:hypothetical protein C8035_v006242 [Colletotrichum spinosum]|uniref:Uncharacterized protein n=1 Tax=Colletotrichum spinosum TaxID=1347390 RepID=A0A4R8Q3N8_9PEZI|nr:hypothetical protein C8035_v006242 [Colletotrichum spinosum]
MAGINTLEDWEVVSDSYSVVSLPASDDEKESRKASPERPVMSTSQSASLAHRPKTPQKVDSASIWPTVPAKAVSRPTSDGVLLERPSIVNLRGSPSRKFTIIGTALQQPSPNHSLGSFQMPRADVEKPGAPGPHSNRRPNSGPHPGAPLSEALAAKCQSSQSQISFKKPTKIDCLSGRARDRPKNAEVTLKMFGGLTDPQLLRLVEGTKEPAFLDSAKLCLERIIEQASELASGPKNNGNEGTKVFSVYHKLVSQAEELTRILTNQFIEYEAHRMSGPSAASVLKRGSWCNTPLAQQRSVSVHHSMSSLNGELHRTVTILEDCLNNLHHHAKKAVEDVVASLLDFLAAIALSLAENQPGRSQRPFEAVAKSEVLWSKGEFEALNTDIIHNFTARLERMNNVIDIGQAEKQLWSFEMVREHNMCMLMEHELLNAIDNVVAVYRQNMVSSQTSS